MTQREYKRHVAEVKSALVDVAKSEQGKCFLRWLVMEECGFMKQLFPRDETLTIWNEAKRDVAVKIVQILQTAGVYDIINNELKDEPVRVSFDKEELE